MISDIEKAECLAKTFLKSLYFTMNYYHPSECKINRHVKNCITQLSFTDNIEFIIQSEMTNIISHLNCTKSSGLDDIPNILLKIFSESGIKLFISIFNSCMQLNYFSI